MRTREEILELLKRFCAENRLELYGSAEADLFVEDLDAGDGLCWSFYPAVGPEGEQ